MRSSSWIGIDAFLALAQELVASRTSGEHVRALNLLPTCFVDLEEFLNSLYEPEGLSPLAGTGLNKDDPHLVMAAIITEFTCPRLQRLLGLFFSGTPGVVTVAQMPTSTTKLSCIDIRKVDPKAPAFKSIFPDGYLAPPSAGAKRAFATAFDAGVAAVDMDLTTLRATSRVYYMPSSAPDLCA